MLVKTKILPPRTPVHIFSSPRQPTRFGICLAIVLLACSSNRAQASPPPNDNFTNRIVLTGTNVPFTGTLAGATFEFFWNEETASFSPEIRGYPILNGFGSTVWWTWTPEQSSTAIFQI